MYRTGNFVLCLVSQKMKPNFTGIHPDQCCEIKFFQIRMNWKDLREVVPIGKFAIFPLLRRNIF